MAFKKGNTWAKRKGKHKKTKMWEAMGNYIVNEGADRYMEILDNLDDKEYLTRFEAILEYFQPKLSRAEVKNEGEQTLVIKKEIID